MSLLLIGYFLIISWLFQYEVFGVQCNQLDKIDRLEVFMSDDEILILLQKDGIIDSRESDNLKIIFLNKLLFC